MRYRNKSAAKVQQIFYICKKNCKIVHRKCTFSAFSVREMTKTNNALPNESALFLAVAGGWLEELENLDRYAILEELENIGTITS